MSRDASAARYMGKMEEAAYIPVYSGNEVGEDLQRNEAQLAAHSPHTRQGIKKFHNVMECDYKGVIYCKKEIGLSGDGRPFLYQIPGT